MKMLFFLFFFLPASAMAQSEAAVINEVAWMGTPVAGIEEKQWWRYEWLELFNTKDYPLQIDGWSIELSRDKLDFSIPLTGTILAKGYFVVASSDKIANADLNYKSLAGKFNNAGQLIVLKDAKGEAVDLVDARSSWPAGNNEGKYTMEKISSEWQTSFVAGGTPKAPNSEGVAKDFSLTRSSYPQLDLVKDKTEKDSSESFWESHDIFQKSLAIASLVAALVAALAVFLRHFVLRPNRRA